MFTDLFKKSHPEALSNGTGTGPRVVPGNLVEVDTTMIESTESQCVQVPDAETTLIGEGANIQGDMDVKGKLNIYGVIEGHIRCDSEVYIGKTGRIVGDVLAMNIKVAGHLEGVLECGELTILEAGKVMGEAATDTFVIEEGGQFEGNSRRRTADNVTQLMRGTKRSQVNAGLSPRPE
ncbi:polymer-forming cytoskeletal protein [Marinobacter sp.]|uniref:bactofilin family protein n=1 Tax=Marinobacter sp. TaxID=50741 RepID=UPI0019A7E64B|nr:polymer-forming cytoskeletal protein [Marinobacter sp.]MBD3657106.1 polymer-forming cytoskeletal protein [Marinobacter sp.]